MEEGYKDINALLEKMIAENAENRRKMYGNVGKSTSDIEQFNNTSFLDCVSAIRSAIDKQDYIIGRQSRKIEELEDSEFRRKQWIRNAKRQVSYDDNISFDDVWNNITKNNVSTSKVNIDNDSVNNLIEKHKRGIENLKQLKRVPSSLITYEATVKHNSNIDTIIQEKNGFVEDLKSLLKN